MASVGFGSRVAAAGVAPASSSSSAGRRRPSRVAMAVGATRGKPAPAEEEKSLADFIFGFIFKKDQLVETDPLLNKVDGAPPSGSTVSRKAPAKKPAASAADEEGGGGGFNLGALFAKKG